VEVSRSKANSFKHFFSLGLHRIAIKVLEFFLKLCEFINQAITVFGLELMKDFFNLPLCVNSIFKRLHGNGYDGIFRLVGEQILIQKADRALIAFTDRTTIGFVFTVN
jgi:hypothetical protein